MNLNVPDTRQRLLGQRLDMGQDIVALDVAAEFDVSVDTIRRDILALEAEGLAHRVRGGAVPVARPASMLLERLSEANSVNPALIHATIAHVGDVPTLLLDGGLTTLSLVAHLPPLDGRLVFTPSPWIAIACQRQGVDVFLLGGQLNPQGGITTGDFALDKAQRISADVAVIGACGLEASFGLSSDDPGEAQMKQAMHTAAGRTFVVTDGSKLGRRARHHTLALDQIDLILTDAPQGKTDSLLKAGARLQEI